MNTEGAGLLAVGLSFVALSVAPFLLRRWRSERGAIRRALRRTNRQRIADLVEGVVVTVSGTVHAIEGELVIRAPLSGRHCVAYMVIVERWNRSTIGWDTVGSEFYGAPFGLEDATGRVVVDPAGAHAVVELTSQTFSGVLDAPTEIEQGLLDRLGLATGGTFFNHDLRYREGVVADGEALIVRGQCLIAQDPSPPPREGGYRDGPATARRLASTPDHRLILSDRD